MPLHENAPGIEQKGEFDATVIRALPYVSRETMQHWISGRPARIQNILRGTLGWGPTLLDDDLAVLDWTCFWRRLFKLELHKHWNRDSIPPLDSPGTVYDKALIVPRGIDIPTVASKIDELFPNRFDPRVNLQDFVHHTRTAEQGYTVRVEFIKSSDPHWAGRNLRETRAAYAKPITLLEWMILFLKFYTETGGWLDGNGNGQNGANRHISACYCGGTRDKRGKMAWVSACGGLIGIQAEKTNTRSPEAGIREVKTLD
jgi:hypothetical protein